jgi:GntR family transcriptional regulator/MocR family aminotransferase
MSLGLILVRRGEESLQRQIYSQIRQHIVSGRLKRGALLPPSRVLAQEQGVSRNTVLQAYDWLASEGYVQTRRSSATMVSPEVPEQCLTIEHASPGSGLPAAQVPKVAVLHTHSQQTLPATSAGACRIDFWPSGLNHRHFPLQAWRKLANARLSVGQMALSAYGDPAGLKELRQAVVDHLALSRGLNVAADQILITAGAQEALNIVARLFITPGVNVVVENPCYRAAAAAFRSHGALLAPLPVDRDGIRVDELHRHQATLAYITPSHQFPTGTTLSMERRETLLDWARNTGAYVIEDDYDSGYQYSRAPLVALAGLDHSDSVIYVGTLSKSIGAGIRLGFAALPWPLVEPARAAKMLHNYGHSWLDQAIVAEFLNSGGYRRYIRVSRRVNQQLRDCLLTALENQFGETEIWGFESGKHVMWHLPPTLPRPADLMAATRKYGVQIHTLSSGGAIDLLGDMEDRAILLGYSALTEAEIKTGIAAIARACTDLASTSKKSRTGD